MKHRRPQFGPVLAAVAVALLSVVSTLAQDKFRMTNLGTLPGGSSSYSNSINASGQVAGYSSLSGAISHAFRFTNGSLQDLGALAGDQLAVGNDINSAGHVIGYSAIPNAQHAAYFDGNTVQSLGTFNDGNFTVGYGINDSDEMVGWGNRAVGEHAFRYSGGTLTDLGTLPGGNFSRAFSINNASKVAGWSQSTSGDRAFIATGNTLTPIGPAPGYNLTYGYGINQLDHVAGYMKAGLTTPPRAFLFDGTNTIDLGTIAGGTMSIVDSGACLNDLGMVVGMSNIPAGNRAFFYTNGTMYNLDTLQVGSDWLLEGYARSINNNGQIAGSGIRIGQGARGYLATPELHWKSEASGSWAAANAWSWGLTPANPHPLFLNRTAAGSMLVNGPTVDTTVAEINLGTAGSGNAELRLQTGVTLTITPGLAGNGQLTVGPKGTLSGNGTITGDVIVQPLGTLSPGASAGEITVNGSVILQSSGSDHANLNIDVDGTPLMLVPSVTFDLITVSGAGKTFTVGGANLNVTPHPNVILGQAYVIVKATNSASIDYTTKFANLVGGTSFTSPTLKYDVSYSSSEISVTFVYTPEPTSVLPLSLAAACYARRRR